MPENFQNLKKETEIQVQETENGCLFIPNKINPSRSTPRHFN